MFIHEIPVLYGAMNPANTLRTALIVSIAMAILVFAPIHMNPPHGASAGRFFSPIICFKDARSKSHAIAVVYLSACCNPYIGRFRG